MENGRRGRKGLCGDGNKMKNFRHVAICVFYDKDLNIFVQIRGSHTRSGFKYGFFGGGIEAGETGKQAMERELIEELGYKPTSLEYWGNYEFVTHNNELEVKCSIFVSPITNELLESKIIEGDGGVIMPIDKVIENNNDEFGQNAVGFIEKLKYDLQNKK